MEDERDEKEENLKRNEVQQTLSKLTGQMRPKYTGQFTWEAILTKNLEGLLYF